MPIFGHFSMRLAPKVIPFPFLITGRGPAVCVSAVAAPLTNSAGWRTGEKGGRNENVEISGCSVPAERLSGEHGPHLHT